jgi:hypothetical protein
MTPTLTVIGVSAEVLLTPENWETTMALYKGLMCMI